MDGFARVAVAIPPVGVADVDENTRAIADLITEAHQARVHVVVFPELSVSSYTARDLFFDRALQDAVERGIFKLAQHTLARSPLVVVGAPLRSGGKLFNVAVFIQSGQILGVVPKSYLPNYREFEETRWFRPGTEVSDGATIRIGDRMVPFGTDLLFHADGVADLVVGAEICEDLWVQRPPSLDQCSAGATVCLNLSASNFTVGKSELRRLLAQSVADRGKCAYLYTAAGPGESSTDLAFDADAFICENGKILKSSTRFSRDPQLVVVDVDLESLVRERAMTNTFGDCAAQSARSFRRVRFAAEPNHTLMRDVSAHPFLPSDDDTLARRCHEIFEIQTHALATRMKKIGTPKLVLGISGGLDSSHAALVAVNALKTLGRPASDLIAVTMPGLGTSTTTRESAGALATALSATLREVSIKEASRLVLELLGHDAAGATVDDVLMKIRATPALGDTTVENVQARLRTLLLMGIANAENGIVVGTGDLSEKALGWSTYGGDHISMYDVNAGVPKTLIQFVMRFVRDNRASQFSGNHADALARVLTTILDTPISPELLPTTTDGAISQVTESTVGPYELHDFFLFHVVRHGRRPNRIIALAKHAFGEKYDDGVLRKWLRVFYQRFFSQQFKRSCTPDGPKVGMVALSPRGDWRMPSDAVVALWIDEIDDDGH